MLRRQNFVRVSNVQDTEWRPTSRGAMSGGNVDVDMPTTPSVEAARSRVALTGGPNAVHPLPVAPLNRVGADGATATATPAVHGGDDDELARRMNGRRAAPGGTGVLVHIPPAIHQMWIESKLPCPNGWTRTHPSFVYTVWNHSMVRRLSRAAVCDTLTNWLVALRTTPREELVVVR